MKSFWVTSIIMAIVLTFICVGLVSCTTTATREDNGTLTIKGIGSAKWSDGTEIKGEPIIKFPQLPTIKYEN